MTFDVFGIGSPLIDLTLKVKDITIEQLGLSKGGMHLFTDKRLKNVLDLLEEEILYVCPGDSTANTVVGVLNLGGNCAYLGKIGDDEHGRLFVSSLKSEGVVSCVVQSKNLTGKVIVLITPDQERTMIVYLGAAKELSVQDIREREIGDSRFLHLTGYQLELPGLRSASLHAMRIAEKRKVKISLDLADSALIGRNLEFLHDIVDKYVDILFANETEAKAFTNKEPDDALDEMSENVGICVVKLGKSGSIIKTFGKVHKIPAFTVDAKDTTGAGDMYAAGVLYGLSRGLPIEKCGRIGAYASSKVVEKLGARLGRGLKKEIDSLSG